MKFCVFCGKEVSLEGRVYRQDTCPNCGADLHCCVQCEFYDEHAHNRCRETDAEWVSDRGKANFCDYFAFRGGAKSEKTKSDDARRKLEELFGKE
jgi:hypothetical protein